MVFFERNGLRHGEFALREQSTATLGEKRWGYKVRELIWNLDSSVLAVWLERDGDLDVGECALIHNAHCLTFFSPIMDIEQLSLVSYSKESQVRICHITVGT